MFAFVQSGVEANSRMWPGGDPVTTNYNHVRPRTRQPPNLRGPPRYARLRGI